MIGGDRRRYHSAIITSYSFDFNFFENRIMPYFAAANIKNVNLFLDGVQLDTTIQHSSGQENMATRSYARNPIYVKGAFHPKIMLLVGKKHGLLIIGSGNMTSSGLNTNEEIWAAFHMDNLGSNNMLIFSIAWNYLQTFASQIKGFNKEQFQWIRTYAPWINEISNSSNSWDINGKETTALYNDSGTISSLEKLLDILPKNEKLLNLNLVSPYFDVNGAFVIELMEQTNPQNVNLLIDKNSELLPTNLDIKQHPEIKIFDWADCVDSFNDSNRLHAKMLHFKYHNKEVLYFGSANATKAAWINSGSNDEFGIVLKRNTSTDYFQELGIVIPPVEKALELNELPPNKNITGTSYEKRYILRIIKAEKNGSKLTLYFHKSIDDELTLKIQNSWNEEIESHNISFQNQEEHSLQIECHDAFKIALFSGEEQVSNFALIHLIEQQLRCNPDPNREKFELALDNAYNNPSDIASLLEYSSFDWADDDGDEIEVSESSAGISIKKKRVEEKKDYKNLSEEEFNAVSEEILLRQRELLESSNVRIAEFLHHYSKGMIVKDEEVSESSEQAMMDSMDTDGDVVLVESVDAKRQFEDDVKNRWAIHRYFKNQLAKYQKPLLPYFNSSVIGDLKTKSTNLKSVSSMLISFQLIDIFHSKKISNENTKNSEKYFDSNEATNVKSIKGFLMHNYGSFLINTMAGYREYDSELVQEKLNNSKKELGTKALIWILNTYWKASELKLKNCLILDTLYSLFPTDDIPNLSKLIYRDSKNISISQTTFERNFAEFAGTVLPAYEQWITQYNANKTALIRNIESLDGQSIMFRNRHGFATVTSIRKNENGFLLGLSKAGFSMGDEDELPIVKNNQFTSKVVMF